VNIAELGALNNAMFGKANKITSAGKILLNAELRTKTFFEEIVNESGKSLSEILCCLTKTKSQDSNSFLNFSD
jgi:hypothetical protein